MTDMGPAGGKRRRFHVWALAAATILVLLMLAQRINQRMQVPEPAPEKPLPVIAVDVQPRAFHTEVDSVGTVTAIKRILVSAQIPATVLEVPNREGAAVQAGSLLVRLDATQVGRELQRQHAATERARAERDYWRAELGADEELYEKGLLGRRNFADSQRRMVALEAAVKEAEALLEIARLRESWSGITAPWSGVVQRNLVLEGEQVQPGAPLVELVASKPLKVVVPVAESNFEDLQVGQAARLRIPAVGMTFKSHVHRIYPALERPSRNATVEILLPPNAEDLFPGMAAEVSIRTRSLPLALTVPRHAVRLQGCVEGVFVAKDGVARWRPVLTGPAQLDQVVISEGIETGEWIIVTPHPGLFEGRSVSLLQPLDGSLFGQASK